MVLDIKDIKWQYFHVHYSVPDTLVGKKLDARIYTDTVVIYQGDTIVAKHSRCFRQGAYILDIYHYLRTLKRKPGALPQSTALMQSDSRTPRLKIFTMIIIPINPKNF